MENKKLPVLFVGHGSPVNVISRNSYTEDLTREAGRLPKPSAYLIISAHWLTGETLISTGEKPEQIYDFYGFPE